MRRKNILSNGGIYHVYSKSIAGYKIFHNNNDYNRIIDLFKYYRIKNTSVKFSKFLEIKNMDIFIEKHLSRKDFLVQIIAYCIMPTHIHLVLMQLQDEGISIFMGNVLNSYSRFFNIRISRKGPLWESRFKNVLVETDEQLIHLTRYLHLNPVTAGLVENAEDWRYSSIKEYLNKRKDSERICNFDSIIELQKLNYKSFVDSQKDYQRELGKIKGLFLD
ncbi:MAG: transposase [Candidatus Omnitrophica bacterium]|nr:transposase [Candidatus Omnitrophota bacterium]